MRLGELRERIPMLRDTIYLDNAATSQKPLEVIDTLSTYYTSRNANIHRSPHRLGQRATEAYEQVRDSIRSVFNASSYEVVFTRGATEALNLVIAGVARSREGKLVTSILDHHSSYVACQQHAAINNQGFEVISDLGSFDANGVSLVSVPMVSNVTGEILEYERIVSAARGSGAVVLLDACQAAPHLLLDCDAVGADAYAFSAHKMLGPTGLGVLIAKRELLESIQPLLYGGEMVEHVSEQATSFAPVPQRFEAGTMPIAQVIAFGEALTILASLDRDELEAHRKDLSKRLVEGVERIGLTVLSSGASDRVPIVSIVGSIHPYDTALLLDSRGIATRAGHHCAQPFHKAHGYEGSLRASAYLYTTSEDIERFLEELEVIYNA